MLYLKAFYIFLYKRRIQYNILFVDVHSSCNFSIYCRKIQKANLKTMVTRKQIMHNFLKTKMFYPLIWISNWVYQEVRNIGFRKILRAFYSCSHRLKIRPFAIVPMHCSYIIVMFCNTFLITSSIILHLNARLILTKLSGSTSVASDEGSSQQLLLSHSVITVSTILGSRENRIFHVFIWCSAISQ